MLIRMKKTPDGVVLSCLRDDASAAVQRTRYGGFFAFHDLLHYAVETTLGWDRAFFGLMASGWGFDTFGGREDPRYRSMPPQAGWAERLVGILSRPDHAAAWREADLLPLLVEEVNRELAHPESPAPPLTPGQIVAIFERFTDLAGDWARVPPGEHLELRFPPARE